jgi:pimeloyl-ACP methyl ester carboxylesterase
MVKASKLSVLAVHAADDTIVSPAAMEQLKALRPDTKNHLWPTGGYAPQWENADVFNQLLVAAVQRHK